MLVSLAALKTQKPSSSQHQLPLLVHICYTKLPYFPTETSLKALSHTFSSVSCLQITKHNSLSTYVYRQTTDIFLSYHRCFFLETLINTDFSTSALEHICYTELPYFQTEIFSSWLPEQRATNHPSRDEPCGA